MKQLSGSDAMFLQFETGNNFMHVASLAIYDPSTAPGGGVRFKDILKFFTSRLEQFPQFRRRLVNVPLSLDRPYWIEDPGFDVEFHVRHIALPYPGDWRQLCIQVARIHSRPLDRSKPLWEAYVIEGLHNIPGVPKGSFAVYSKMHHAIIDGESGTELLKALHSISPEPADDAELARKHLHVDREPTTIELYSRAVVHNLQRVPSLAKFSVNSARRLGTLGAELAGKARGENLFSMKTLRELLSGDLGALVPQMPPKTRFSEDVSGHRVFEAVGLPLQDFKAIRHHVGEVTINDMFLCIVGGALRKYLQSKRELPEGSMAAMVPISLRGADKGGDVGNQVGATMMQVRTDIADPVKRLLAIRDGAQEAKRLTDAIGREFARDLMEYVPNVVSQVVARYARPPRIGLIISNVRGPDVPLYMAGARLVNYSPISIPTHGLGLNVTGFSYAGTMWICAVSCRDMLPDPAFFATCMRESFEEMKVAASKIRTVDHAKTVPQLPGGNAGAGRKAGSARKPAAGKAHSAPVGTRRAKARRAKGKRGATRRAA